MQGPSIQVRLPEEKPVVGIGVPAADSVAEVSKGFVKVDKVAGTIGQLPIPRPNQQDLRALGIKDPCLRKLYQTQWEVAHRPLPTQGQKDQAWKKVEAAYLVWLGLKEPQIKKQEDLEKLAIQIINRKAWLKRTASRQLINKLRLRMGPKFAGVHRPGSRAQMSPER